MDGVKPRFLAGIFLISSATLCLEISLTRYFSVSQQYHFAFWVVSIAFLGYGASGSFLSLFKRLRSADRDKFLPFSALLYGLSILLCFLVCNNIPFDFISLSWDKSQIYYVFLFYVLLSLPFFFAGLTISFAITTYPAFVNNLYFSDLMGAGIGTLLSIFIFLPKGDKGVILFISLLAIGASYLFSRGRSFLFKSFLLFLMAVVVALFLKAPSWLSFRISAFKALPVALKFPQAKHHFTRWNAISRVDVIESPAVRYAPGLSLLYQEPLPPQLGLSVDGGQLTAITRFRGIQEKDLDFLSFLPSSLAYSLVQNPHTLIIEPKGGLDVLAALVNRTPKIKVTENNPLIGKILRQDLASFSGGLYEKDEISVVTAYSRAALQTEKESFDLIVFSLSDVFGAFGTGLYGFGENYLYTVDSFLQIIKRLSSQGMVSMSLYLLPPARQEARALATWIEALEKSGRNASSHIVALRSWGTISYFIKKSSFKKKDIQKLKGFATRCLFDLVYYPGIKIEEVNLHNKFDNPVYYELALSLLDPSTRKKLYKNYLFDIRPATDNRPFFFNFFKMTKLKATYNALAQKWPPFLQGHFLVFLLFFQSIIVAFAFILLPLIVFRKEKRRQRRTEWRVFLYFSLIGLAYIFVEITFIQKFILFLGHPLFSISLIIFSLLFSSGLGSFFSKKILGQKIKKNLVRVLFLCGGLILFYLLLLQFFYKNFIGHPLSLKIILTFLFIFPLGFFMGFPFPSGIRLLEPEEKSIIPWAWATNAFSSVIHSISALMVAFYAGYNLVLFLAAVGYLLTIPFLGFSHHGNKTHS